MCRGSLTVKRGDLFGVRETRVRTPVEILYFFKKMLEVSLTLVIWTIQWTPYGLLVDSTSTIWSPCGITLVTWTLSGVHINYVDSSLLGDGFHINYVESRELEFLWTSSKSPLVPHEST